MPDSILSYINIVNGSMLLMLLSFDMVSLRRIELDKAGDGCGRPECTRLETVYSRS